MSRWFARVRRVVALLAAAVVAAAPVTGTARATAPTAPVCLTAEVPVAVEPGNPLVPGAPALSACPGPPAALSVRTCVPGSGEAPRGVQLLVHGAVTDHRYWNLPDPDGTGRNSWEAAALAAGWATASVDRLGSGASSHPPSGSVTLDANASALSTLARSLRAGQVPVARGSLRAERVVFVGHSQGSGVVALAASRFGDADALVLTGYSHHIPQPYASVAFASALQPAALEPRFAGLDAGYLTTRAGARGFLYAPGTDVDARLLARDEATKGTVTVGELAGGGALQQTVLRGVTVPVLVLTGDRDGLFCSQTAGDLGADCSSGAALAAGERPWFPAAPSVSAVVVPGAGHMLNAFGSAPEAFAAAIAWLAT